MAATETSISNLALQMLGEPAITSLTDDNKAARAMNTCFAQMRDVELEKHVWKFARALSIPALSASTPAFDYAYAFDLPSDFLRLVLPADNTCDWEVFGSQLFTNESSVIRLTYIKRTTDPTKFPPTFVAALAAALAEQTCEAITQSDAKKNYARSKYDEAVALARRTNAMQRIPQATPDDPWLTVRRT